MDGQFNLFFNFNHYFIPLSRGRASQALVEKHASSWCLLRKSGQITSQWFTAIIQSRSRRPRFALSSSSLCGTQVLRRTSGGRGVIGGIYEMHSAPSNVIIILVHFFFSFRRRRGLRKACEWKRCNPSVPWLKRFKFDLTQSTLCPPLQKRPLSYPGTNVFLICFSVSSRASVANLASLWVPEVQHHCAGVPFIIVACKVGNDVLLVVVTVTSQIIFALSFNILFNYFISFPLQLSFEMKLALFQY